MRDWRKKEEGGVFILDPLAGIIYPLLSWPLSSWRMSVRVVQCLSHSGYRLRGWTKQDYSGSLVLLSRVRPHAGNPPEMS